MDSADIIICEKHHRKQKSYQQIPSNYFICMNRYCPQAYSILCSSCKLDHRDHQVKVLSIQDIAFLIDRLLKMPFRLAGTFILESVEILKKLKLVSQFARKIITILSQLQQESLDLISMTQNIISQYAQCKTSALQISQALSELETKESVEQFKKNIVNKLSKIDYNIQKDRLEYGNLQIKEKEDTRKKNLGFVKRKIQQVKQYSMKIIEVILNNDESDEEDQDFAQKKRVYETLKADIAKMEYIGYPLKDHKEPEKNSKPEQLIETQLTSKHDVQVETENKWIEEYEKTIKNLEAQLQAEKLFQRKIESDFKTKVISYQKDKQFLSRQRDLLIKERENLRKEKEKIQKNYEQKCQFFKHYEGRLRDNFQKRSVRYKQRQQVIKQLAELIQHQRIDSRGRDSAQKENRANSKSKKS